MDGPRLKSASGGAKFTKPFRKESGEIPNTSTSNLPPKEPAKRPEQDKEVVASLSYVRRTGPGKNIAFPYAHGRKQHLS